MFTIRQAHMDAFSEASRGAFEERMVGHLRSRFPEQCQEAGEERVRQRINDGIKRAARYDIRTERDVATFIRYTFGIRPDFDTSRKTPWARPILEDRECPATERLRRIKVAAREHRSSQQG